MHEAGFLHLDIKPDNVCTSFDFPRVPTGKLERIEGLAKNIFLIDYGLAQSYLDADGNHRP